MTQSAPYRTRAAAGVVPGLAAMLGTGLFVGLAPAAAEAGHWLFAAIGLAFLAALCSALSTSDQSMRFAGIGGGYLYTRHQLGVLPGRMAGSAALVGRICAGAAVAGTFGAYVVPEQPVYAAVAVSVAALVLDAFGFRPPRGLVTAILVVVVLTLILVVVVCFAIAPPPALPLPSDVAGADDFTGLLAAAGIMFFAFLGFEQVTSSSEPAYTVRQRFVAIPVIMMGTLAAGLGVGAAMLHQLGGARLALSPTPMRDALAAADGQSLQPVVSGAIGLATLLGLITTVATIRRTVSAMAEFSDVPPTLANVGPRGVSAPAAVLSGIAVAVAAALLNPPQAIGLAACLLLFYYAFTNASARLLLPTDRTWPRRSACFGLGFSVLLGMNMSVKYLVAALVVMAAGCLAGAVSSRYARK